jgi:hypothetical protein
VRARDVVKLNPKTRILEPGVIVLGELGRVNTGVKTAAAFAEGAATHSKLAAPTMPRIDALDLHS